MGVAVGAAGACAYVLVDWPGGKAFRRWMGLPSSDFHVTLGFDGEDPHDVRKDKSTLLRPPPARGWPQGEAGALAMQAAVLAQHAYMLFYVRLPAGGAGPVAPPAEDRAPAGAREAESEEDAGEAVPRKRRALLASPPPLRSPAPRRPRRTVSRAAATLPWRPPS
jgi:hypothetical protein